MPLGAGTLTLTNFAAAAVLAAAATVSPRMRSWSRRSQACAGILVAVLTLVDAILLAAYVFGEDDYRGNGISRWEAYRSPGGALGPMFVVALVLLGLAAACLALAGLRGRPRLLGGTALATALVCVFLVTATIIGFSVN